MAAQEVGTELRDQQLLDAVTFCHIGPDFCGKGAQCRQIATNRRIVFGSGMQATHHLAAAFDGLFGKGVAAADPQSHLQLAQSQGRRIEIDVAELLL